MCIIAQGGSRPMTPRHVNPGMGRARRSVVVGTPKDAGGRDACSLGSPNPALVGLEVGTSHAPVGLKGSVEPKIFLRPTPLCCARCRESPTPCPRAVCWHAGGWAQVPRLSLPPKGEVSESMHFYQGHIVQPAAELHVLVWRGSLGEGGTKGIISEHSGWLLGFMKSLDIFSCL